jgi:hypothetical protein
MRIHTPFFPLLLVCASIGAAQTAQTVPVSATGVTASLPQLDQTARQTAIDLGKLRVERWKTDNNTKEQARDNAASLQKNLTSALPGLMQQVQANPASVGAAVKLYRNLNVVYDVLASVTESTGAFGSKEDYQALATDTGNLDNLRRNIADSLEQMALAQDASYVQLVNQAKAQQQAAAAEPAKKVIVDDTEPAKKTGAKKKKPATTTTPATASTPQ